MSKKNRSKNKQPEVQPFERVGLDASTTETPEPEFLPEDQVPESDTGFEGAKAAVTEEVDQTKAELQEELEKVARGEIPYVKKTDAEGNETIYVSENMVLNDNVTVEPLTEKEEKDASVVTDTVIISGKYTPNVDSRETINADPVSLQKHDEPKNEAENKTVSAGFIIEFYANEKPADKNWLETQTRRLGKIGFSDVKTRKGKEKIHIYVGPFKTERDATRAKRKLAAIGLGGELIEKVGE